MASVAYKTTYQYRYRYEDEPKNYAHEVHNTNTVQFCLLQSQFENKK